jgi:dienelactone hydrolase
MKRIRMIGLCLLAACAMSAVAAASASAEQRVQYAAYAKDFAQVHPGGSIPLLLLHEAGWTYESTQRIAAAMAEVGFTVLNLEWQEYSGRGIWGFDTAQIEEAVRYVQANAGSLGVDATHLTMLGGSRGANLALLTALDMDLAAPGTVKAIAALSGDVDPAKQIERGQRGELDSGAAGRLSKAYDCEPILVNCPAYYVARWSPLEKATARAPAMFLAASEAERKTAWLEDQYELAAKLEACGVPNEVFAAVKGHGFDYWHSVKVRVSTFLKAQLP